MSLQTIVLRVTTVFAHHHAPAGFLLASDTSPALPTASYFGTAAERREVKGDAFGRMASSAGRKCAHHAVSVKVELRAVADGNVLHPFAQCAPLH